MKRFFVTVLLLGPAMLFAQEPQSEFLPVTEVPPGEQLPSAPLLIAAYAFVWAAVLVYAWLMWRRLGKVEQELNTLSAQISRKRT